MSKKLLFSSLVVISNVAIVGTVVQAASGNSTEAGMLTVDNSSTSSPLTTLLSDSKSNTATSLSTADFTKDALLATSGGTTTNQAASIPSPLKNISGQVGKAADGNNPDLIKMLSSLMTATNQQNSASNISSSTTTNNDSTSLSPDKENAINKSLSECKEFLGKAFADDKTQEVIFSILEKKGVLHKVSTTADSEKRKKMSLSDLLSTMQTKLSIQYTNPLSKELATCIQLLSSLLDTITQGKLVSDFIKRNKDNLEDAFARGQSALDMPNTPPYPTEEVLNNQVKAYADNLYTSYKHELVDANGIQPIISTISGLMDEESMRPVLNSKESDITTKCTENEHKMQNDICDYEAIASTSTLELAWLNIKSNDPLFKKQQVEYNTLLKTNPKALPTQTETFQLIFRDVSQNLKNSNTYDEALKEIFNRTVALAYKAFINILCTIKEVCNDPNHQLYDLLMHFSKHMGYSLINKDKTPNIPSIIQCAYTLFSDSSRQKRDDIQQNAFNLLAQYYGQSKDTNLIPELRAAILKISIQRLYDDTQNKNTRFVTYSKSQPGTFIPLDNPITLKNKIIGDKRFEEISSAFSDTMIVEFTSSDDNNNIYGINTDRKSPSLPLELVPSKEYEESLVTGTQMVLNKTGNAISSKDLVQACLPIRDQICDTMNLNKYDAPWYMMLYTDNNILLSDSNKGRTTNATIVLYSVTHARNNSDQNAYNLNNIYIPCTVKLLENARSAGIADRRSSIQVEISYDRTVVSDKPMSSVEKIYQGWTNSYTEKPKVFSIGTPKLECVNIVSNTQADVVVQYTLPKALEFLNDNIHAVVAQVQSTTKEEDKDNISVIGTQVSKSSNAADIARELYHIANATSTLSDNAQPFYISPNVSFIDEDSRNALCAVQSSTLPESYTNVSSDVGKISFFDSDDSKKSEYSNDYQSLSIIKGLLNSNNIDKTINADAIPSHTQQLLGTSNVKNLRIVNSNNNLYNVDTTPIINITEDILVKASTFNTGINKAITTLDSDLPQDRSGHTVQGLLISQFGVSSEDFVNASLDIILGISPNQAINKNSSSISFSNNQKTNSGGGSLISSQPIIYVTNDETVQTRLANALKNKLQSLYDAISNSQGFELESTIRKYNELFPSTKPKIGVEISQQQQEVSYMTDAYARMSNIDLYYACKELFYRYVNNTLNNDQIKQYSFIIAWLYIMNLMSNSATVSGAPTQMTQDMMRIFGIPDECTPSNAIWIMSKGVAEAIQKEVMSTVNNQNSTGNSSSTNSSYTSQLQSAEYTNNKFSLDVKKYNAQSNSKQSSLLYKLDDDGINGPVTLTANQIYEADNATSNISYITSESDSLLKETILNLSDIDTKKNANGPYVSIISAGNNNDEKSQKQSVYIHTNKLDNNKTYRIKQEECLDAPILSGAKNAADVLALLSQIGGKASTIDSPLDTPMCQTSLLLHENSIHSALSMKSGVYGITNSLISTTLDSLRQRLFSISSSSDQAQIDLKEKLEYLNNNSSQIATMIGSMILKRIGAFQDGSAWVETRIQNYQNAVKLNLASTNPTAVLKDINVAKYADAMVTKMLNYVDVVQQGSTKSIQINSNKFKNDMNVIVSSYNILTKQVANNALTDATDNIAFNTFIDQYVNNMRDTNVFDEQITCYNQICKQAFQAIYGSNTSPLTLQQIVPNKFVVAQSNAKYNTIASSTQKNIFSQYVNDAIGSGYIDSTNQASLFVQAQGGMFGAQTQQSQDIYDVGFSLADNNTYYNTVPQYTNPLAKTNNPALTVSDYIYHSALLIGNTCITLMSQSEDNTNTVYISKDGVLKMFNKFLASASPDLVAESKLVNNSAMLNTNNTMSFINHNKNPYSMKFSATSHHKFNKNRLESLSKMNLWEHLDQDARVILKKYDQLTINALCNQAAQIAESSVYTTQSQDASAKTILYDMSPFCDIGTPFINHEIPVSAMRNHETLKVMSNNNNNATITNIIKEHNANSGNNCINLDAINRMITSKPATQGNGNQTSTAAMQAMVTKQISEDFKTSSIEGDLSELDTLLNSRYACTANQSTNPVDNAQLDGTESSFYTVMTNLQTHLESLNGLGLTQDSISNIINLFGSMFSNIMQRTPEQIQTLKNKILNNLNSRFGINAPPAIADLTALSAHVIGTAILHTIMGENDINSSHDLILTYNGKQINLTNKLQGLYNGRDNAGGEENPTIIVDLHMENIQRELLISNGQFVSTIDVLSNMVMDFIKLTFANHAERAAAATNANSPVNGTFNTISVPYLTSAPADSINIVKARIQIRGNDITDIADIYSRTTASLFMNIDNSEVLGNRDANIIGVAANAANSAAAVVIPAHIDVVVSKYSEQYAANFIAHLMYAINPNVSESSVQAIRKYIEKIWNDAKVASFEANRLLDINIAQSCHSISTIETAMDLLHRACKSSDVADNANMMSQKLFGSICSASLAYKMLNSLILDVSSSKRQFLGDTIFGKQEGLISNPVIRNIKNGIKKLDEYYKNATSVSGNIYTLSSTASTNIIDNANGRMTAHNFLQSLSKVVDTPATDITAQNVQDYKTLLYAFFKAMDPVNIVNIDAFQLTLAQVQELFARIKANNSTTAALMANLDADVAVRITDFKDILRDLYGNRASPSPLINGANINTMTFTALTQDPAKVSYETFMSALSTSGPISQNFIETLLPKLASVFSLQGVILKDTDMNTYDNSPHAKHCAWLKAQLLSSGAQITSDTRVLCASIIDPTTQNIKYIAHVFNVTNDSNYICNKGAFYINKQQVNNTSNLTNNNLVSIYKNLSESLSSYIVDELEKNKNEGIQKFITQFNQSAATSNGHNVNNVRKRMLNVVLSITQYSLLAGVASSQNARQQSQYTQDAYMLNTQYMSDMIGQIINLLDSMQPEVVEMLLTHIAADKTPVQQTSAIFALSVALGMTQDDMQRLFALFKSIRQNVLLHPIIYSNDDYAKRSGILVHSALGMPTTTTAESSNSSNGVMFNIMTAGTLENYEHQISELMHTLKNAMSNNVIYKIKKDNTKNTQQSITNNDVANVAQPQWSSSNVIHQSLFVQPALSVAPPASIIVPTSSCENALSLRGMLKKLTQPAYMPISNNNTTSSQQFLAFGLNMPNDMESNTDNISNTPQINFSYNNISDIDKALTIDHDTLNMLYGELKTQLFGEESIKIDYVFRCIISDMLSQYKKHPLIMSNKSMALVDLKGANVIIISRDDLNKFITNSPQGKDKKKQIKLMLRDILHEQTIYDTQQKIMPQSNNPIDTFKLYIIPSKLGNEITKYNNNTIVVNNYTLSTKPQKKSQQKFVSIFDNPQTLSTDDVESDIMTASESEHDYSAAKNIWTMINNTKNSKEDFIKANDQISETIKQYTHTQQSAASKSAAEIVDIRLHESPNSENIWEVAQQKAYTEQSPQQIIAQLLSSLSNISIMMLVPQNDMLIFHGNTIDAHDGTLSDRTRSRISNTLNKYLLDIIKFTELDLSSNQSILDSINFMCEFIGMPNNAQDNTQVKLGGYAYQIQALKDEYIKLLYSCIAQVYCKHIYGGIVDHYDKANLSKNIDKICNSLLTIISNSSPGYKHIQTFAAFMKRLINALPSNNYRAWNATYSLLDSTISKYCVSNPDSANVKPLQEIQSTLAMYHKTLLSLKTQDVIYIYNASTNNGDLSLKLSKINVKTTNSGSNNQLLNNMKMNACGKLFTGEYYDTNAETEEVYVTRNGQQEGSETLETIKRSSIIDASCFQSEATDTKNVDSHNITNNTTIPWQDAQGNNSTSSTTVPLNSNVKAPTLLQQQDITTKSPEDIAATKTAVIPPAVSIIV